MGWDALGWIFFLTSTPLILVGFVLFWVVTARDHSAIEELWTAYAQKRGLELVPATGEWPNRTNPAMTWTKDGTTFRIAARGREASMRTRASATPSGVLLGSFRAIVEGGTIALAGRPESLAARIVDDAVRRELLAFHQGARLVLSYRRGVIALEWRGAERNDARLDEARVLLERLAARLDDAFAGRPARTDAA
jgi:hypothetical protein